MKDKETKILIVAVFIAGLCSIVYELLIATASSYFLGDSIKQFSITIGSYMAAMGVGSYLSRHISDKQLLVTFIKFELLLGVIGGFSVPLLYLAFAFTSQFQLCSILLTICIGILIGLEIPLLSRLLEQYYSLKVNISNVLSVDYFGALIATLVFPLVLLPTIGTFKTSMLFGLINMSIAVILLWCFSSSLSIARKNILWFHTGVSSFMLACVFILSNFLLGEWSNSLYSDRIVFAKETPYQNIVMTKNKDDVRLYLNGNLQFSSSDEYRYHEALVHVPLHLMESVSSVLVLGGGDGLGVRELLKHSSIKNIKLIDLDPEISRLGKENNHLLSINGGSLHRDIVEVINQDAFTYLLNDTSYYDVIIIDLPDPNNASLARMYSKEFYKLVKLHLTESGVFVTQATSPFFAAEAFWTIFSTVKAAGFEEVLPYHVNVPSFGEWGFVIGTMSTSHQRQSLSSLSTRYLDDQVISNIWTFGKDIGYRSMAPSFIDRPVVLEKYLKGWSYWN